MEKIVNIVLYPEDSDAKQLKLNDYKAALFYNNGKVEYCSLKDAYKYISKIILEEKQIDANKDKTESEIFKELIKNRKRIFKELNSETFNENISKYKVFDDNTINDITSKIEEYVEQEDFVENNKLANENKAQRKEEQIEDEYFDEEIVTNDKEYFEEKEQKKETNEDKQKGIKGIFKKIKNKIKKHKVTNLAIALSAILGLSGISAYAMSNKSLEGKMLASNITLEATDNCNNDDIVKAYANNQYVTPKTGEKITLTSYTNNQDSETNSNSTDFSTLLNKSTDENQKKVMQQISNALDMFNINFSDAYLETGKPIASAMSWDEMMSLIMAYNDASRTYKPCEIRKIFNGTRVDDEELENAYKNATLQLIGAFIIEKEGNLVDLSKLIFDEEELAFGQKYQNLLENIKNTTGEEQIEAVKAFYDELYKDFPITENVRTEGISHADTRNLESYKLVVAPMVAAAEMMFQNLNIDETLSNTTVSEQYKDALDYFNDLGLCNLAKDTFEELETITLTNCDGPDESLPLYEDFKQAKIKELTYTGHYVIDDSLRDISQLDSFQKRVNGKKFNLKDGKFVTTSVTDCWSYTTTNTWSETSTYSWTDTSVETYTETIPESDYKWEIVDTTDNTEKIQEEADKEKEQLEKEVKKDDKEFQKDIDKANETIDKNNSDTDKSNDEKVNEKDFGDNNVDFDDEHSDDQGNLDDSVKDITTDDGSSTKTDEDDVKDQTDLPDPSETGKEFDESYEEQDTANNNEQEENINNEQQESNSDEQQETGNDETNLPNPEETGEEFDNECETIETTTTTETTVIEETYEEVEETTKLSNEERIDQFFESLENVNENDISKVLTK